jgi:hypothetical protein
MRNRPGVFLTGRQRSGSRGRLQCLSRIERTQPVSWPWRWRITKLALPRGGVPVAAKVAAALNAPLDLILVRKIGVPYQPELAMGAVVDGDKPLVVRNEDVIRLCRHRRFPARGLKAGGAFQPSVYPY